MMMRSILRAAPLALLAGCAGIGPAELKVRPVVPDGYSSDATGASDHYETGKRQLAAGNAGLAIDAFRKAVRADPTSVDALNGLGVAYDRIARFDLSRRYYEQALGLEPRSVVVLHNYGYSLALQGRAEEGRELMARAAAAGDAAVAAKAQQNLARLPAARITDPPAEAAATAARRWIERTTALVQTLVTESGVEPAGPIEPRLRKVHDVAGSIRQAHSDYAVPSTAEAVSTVAAMTGDLVTTAASAASEPLQVVNAVGRTRMAMRMRGYLERHGVDVAGLSNGAARNKALSEIRYDAARREAALAIARLLPFEVALRPRLAPADGVTLVLGRNALGFDDKLQRQHQEV